MTFENYTLNHKIDWSGSEVPVPYFVAKAAGVGTQFLSALVPRDLEASVPAYSPVSVSHGTAGKVVLEGAEYLVFCQPMPTQEVLIDNRLRTTAKGVIAKTTGGELEYIFAIEATHSEWIGLPDFTADSPRSFLYLPRDPVTGGASVTTVADEWVPD